MQAHVQKTILITGASDGIGLATAEKLISLGHNVLLHGRNPDKLQKVVDTLKPVNNEQKIETYIADLSNMQAVQSLAKEVAKNHDSLDVLINNAGILKTANTITDDGLDIRFAVNTFAPILLTRELLPLLSHNTSRVISLSSAAQAPVNLQALAGGVKLDDMGAYAQSKLALTTWSQVVFETSERFRSSFNCDQPRFIISQ
ncbi:SDR family NAD(P)-dependent oxidoreductase [Paraglaciecola algarum]|uniref:SDR family NAD(P)-dependent oxidoreductase n=1 Tax=Paraglaciecola algarum TaxID=3050085 RepID=UPI0032EA6D2B